MAPKRRAPPLQFSSGEEEVEEAVVPPPQGPPQPPPSPAAAAEDSGSHQDAGAQASQMRSPGSKPVAHEEEDGGPAEPEPKKAPAPNKKGPAPDPGRSGKSKKAAKAEVGKVAPEAAPIGKGKKKTKADVEQEKVGPLATPIDKGKKKKTKANAEQKGTPGPASSGNAGKSRVKLGESAKANAEQEKVGPLATPIDKGKKKKTKANAEQKGTPGPASSGNAGKSRVKLGESAKANAAQEKGTLVPAASGNADKSKIKLRESAGAKAAQDKGTPGPAASGNKGQANKKSVSGNSKGGAVKVALIQNIGTHQKGSNRDNAAEVETDTNVNTKLSKQGAATLNADALVIEKGGRTNREASTGNENGGTEAEKENHGDDAEIEASIQGAPKSFDEMQKLYPQLARYVESVEPPPPLNKETLKMAFGFMSDETAKALESEMEEVRKRQADTLIFRWKVEKMVLDMFVPSRG